MSEEGAVQAAIEAFWLWWPDGRVALEEAIESGEWAMLAGVVGEAVHAIHPDLQWELGPGKEARHHFCISAAGSPPLRVLVERWLAEAPEPDEDWEFYPSRQARPGTTLQIGDHAVDTDSLRVAYELDEGRECVHLTIYHPAFDDMKDDLKDTTAFLFLDGAFGEDAVERWIGGVEAVREEPEGAVSWAEVLEAVNELGANATGEGFAILQGEDDEGMPLFAVINRSLKRIDHMLYDLHVELTIPLASPTPHGMPDREEADTLNVMEEGLLEILGDSAIYIGRETHRGVRTLHFHTAGSSGAFMEIERWVASVAPGYVVEVNVAADPRWDALRRWF